MRTRCMFGAGLAVAALALGAPSVFGKGGGKPGGGGGTPAPAEIVYDDGAIKVMAADGSGSTRIFAATGFAPQPVWSGDGTQIAFNSTHDGAGIYVMNADGSGVTKVASLASEYVSGPEWSPAPVGASYWILFQDDGEDNDRDIFAVRPDGSGRVNLTRELTRILDNSGDGHKTVAESACAWSPDARHFVATVGYNEGGAYGEDLWIFDVAEVDGALVATIGTAHFSDLVQGLELKEDFMTPSWSHDGSYLAVSVADATWYDLWIVDLDGLTAENVENSTGTIFRYPSWSPDDSAIVFWRTGSNTRNSGIYRMYPDGTGQVKLASGRNPDWKR